MKPWMSQLEIDTILKYLKPDFSMLEWGCGGSTLCFPNYVNSYYSIEHDKEWYEKIKAQISKNVKIVHVPRQSDTGNVRSKNYAGLNNTSRFKDFHNYIKYPANFGTTFDAVLVDGRARPECAKFIIDYINKDSVIFVHDYFYKNHRVHYHVLEEKYKVIDSVKTGQTLAVLKMI